MLADQGNAQQKGAGVQLGMFHWNMRTDLVILDHRAQQIFGVTSPQVPIQDLLAVVHPDDRWRVHSAVESLRGMLSRCDLEYRVVHNGLATRNVASVSVGIPGSDGLPENRYGAVNDLTQQKRREVHDAFLADLTNDFSQSSTQDLMAVVGARLGAHLGVTTCNFAAVAGGCHAPAVRCSWSDSGAPSLLPVFETTPRLTEEFCAVSIAGETVAVRDTQADARTISASLAQIGVRSFVNAPFLVGDELRYFLFITDNRVRDWRKDEVAVFEEVAHRFFLRFERAQAEEALRASEAKYRSLFDSIDEGFCIVEVLFDDHARPIDYRFLETNQMFERQSGLHNALGKRMRDLAPSHDDYWFQVYGAVAKTGQPVRFENGSAALGRWWNVFAFRSGAPSANQVAVLFKDITAQKASLREREELSRQIAAERERLHQVFMQAPVAVTVFRGPEFVIELANPAAQALTRNPHVLDRPLGAVMPELGRDVWTVLHRVRVSGEPYAANAWYMPYDADQDGTLEDHWFNVAYEPLREADGSVSGVVAVFNEVTAQVRIRQQLERINRSLQEFTHVASHDLQEPLRTVHIYSELLIDRLGKNATEEQQRFASVIQRSVRRMQKLIKDLLAYSRTVHTEEDISASVANLNEALQLATTALEHRLNETHATITADNLPNVRGETAQLAHVFQNLLSNAIKYRKKDEPPRITITARQTEQQWVIEIRDNGIGFEPRHADRIFGLFKRLHRETDYPGTGLGLAICKHIVERYNGTIWAESTLGLGATFYLALPAAS